MPNSQTKPEYTDIALRLDFYGQLLTEKTREVLELYYFEDMSLTEIANEIGISRQGVHDRLKQGTKNLSTYENKLQLAEKLLKQRHIIQEILTLLKQEDVTKAEKLIMSLNDLW